MFFLETWQKGVSNLYYNWKYCLTTFSPSLSRPYFGFLSSSNPHNSTPSTSTYSQIWRRQCYLLYPPHDPTRPSKPKVVTGDSELQKSQCLSLMEPDIFLNMMTMMVKSVASKLSALLLCLPRRDPLYTALCSVYHLLDTV